MHLHSDDDLVNSINYMSVFTKNTTFLGFKENASSYGFGVEINGKDYVALHMYNGKINRCVSDSEVKETAYINDGYLYALVIYGIDNTSYVKRFMTEKALLKWVNNRTVISVNNDASFLYYNS